MTPAQMALGDGCQRWLHRRARYRPPGEVFDPSRCMVALIDEATAKPWVIAHHYSASYPAARARVGLFFKEPFRREQLGGVAVFSVPMNQAVVPRYLGVTPVAGAELGRFVILDHEVLAANAETWFLARAFRAAQQQLSITGVVAYCDPVPRVASDGAVTKRGHMGTIYQAHNGRFAGRSAPRSVRLLPNGRSISDRTLSKFRGGDVGAAYAERLLRDGGCRARRAGELPRVYLERPASAPVLRKARGKPAGAVVKLRVVGDGCMPAVGNVLLMASGRRYRVESARGRLIESLVLRPDDATSDAVVLPWQWTSRRGTLRTKTMPAGGVAL
jgi:hypothetical protein